MPGSTKKRKGAQQSDFKRIKAKVGKKALKPANVTDTSFKAVAVQVKNQQADSLNAKLLSERGHSIQQLATQLNHPAAAVRTSAIRGLANVVDSHGESLKAHLSILLPAVAKCCVDQHDTVRQLGLGVLKTILTSATCEEQVMRPFLPLLTAYTTSALNSLDRSTRLDGARAVEILSTSLPSLMGSQAETLLPAFVTLLSDYHSQRRPTAATTKRKSKSGSNENGRLVILQSLVALLNTVPQKNTLTNDGFVHQNHDVVFVPGGRTVNALLLAGREERSVRPIQSISELPSFIGGSLDTVSFKQQSPSVDVANDIVSKLRDIFIELSQRGGTQGSKGGILLSALDIEELSLLNQAISLFWNAYCCGMILHDGNDSEQSLEKGFTSVLSLMMESFPAWQQSTNADLVTKCALLNTDICATLMDIGGHLEANSKEINWSRKVLDYLLPRLGSDAMVPLQGDTIVNVLSNLFLLKSDTREFTLTEKTRRKILQNVCDAFFVENIEADFARLASSRRAVSLILAMLENENYILESGNAFDESLQMAIKTLPFYLKAWKGDFLVESRELLSGLQDVSRRLVPDNQSDEAVLDCLRKGMSLLFEVPKRLKRQKKIPRTQSIFELYPEETQRQVLGLLVMIQSPSEATINDLGYICSRCGTSDVGGSVSDTIADAVLYSVHSVRRSMPMQAYLAFIIKTIGVDRFDASQKEKDNSSSQDKNAEQPEDTVVDKFSASETSSEHEIASRKEKSVETQIDIGIAKALEPAVLRAARSCILSGSLKVLSMIYPLMNEWLASMRPSSNYDPSAKAARFRTACSLCAMLVLDTETSVLDIASDLARNLVAATCDLFTMCFPRGSNHDLIDKLQYLMQPIVVSSLLILLHFFIQIMLPYTIIYM
jgi:pre-rRNA-processing protein IPI1